MVRHRSLANIGFRTATRRHNSRRPGRYTSSTGTTEFNHAPAALVFAITYNNMIDEVRRRVRRRERDLDLPMSDSYEETLKASVIHGRQPSAKHNPSAQEENSFLHQYRRSLSARD